jgi:D-glycero-D-manno-heptose 1,7-bisphosphate phosphatase
MSEAPFRAVFLDRDGVINALVARGDEMDSPQRPGELRLLPGAAAGIRKLNALGLPVVVVSNQPGIAKGKSSLDLLDATTALLRRRLAARGASVSAIYYCLHHPQAVQAKYRRQCDCRKPRPGLLEAAARDLNLDLAGSYMVGDRGVDLRAGQAVRSTTVLVSARPSAAGADRPDFTCGGLSRAADWIVATELSRRRRPAERQIRLERLLPSLPLLSPPGGESSPLYPSGEGSLLKLEVVG